jgi:hypothetical protein
MTSVSVYAAGSYLVAFNSASIKRSASNLITTAQIQAPLDILSNIQADDDIAIEVDGEVLFHGVAADWTLNYSGGNTSISIPCVDYTYKLSHMVVSTTVTTYASGTDIGAVVYALLADTGIDRSHINQATGITLAEDLEVGPGEMRLSILQTIAKKYNCMFYLSYGKLGATYKTYGEFDTYDNMEAAGDFAVEHTITDANTPIFTLSIKNQPDNVCTRVIAIRDNAGVQEIGVATTGSAPYTDKVVSVNVNDTTDIDTLAASLLTNFRRGIAKIDLSFRNLAVGLFNVVDLSAVCAVLGVTFPLMEFRVTDLDYTISADGIVTKTTGIDPDAELWERTVREQAGEQTVANVVQAEAEYQAEEAKPVYAEVIA